jgi:glycosyltransferase involved in cell wall biosynthesis
MISRKTMSGDRSILMIGNLLGLMRGGASISETLGPFLISRGWRVYMASGKKPRLARLYDMLATSWKYRSEYQCAFVEVFSGPAFIWAEIVCFFLRMLGKPYVLGLFGGNLPAFVRINAGRVRALLNSAKSVITPSPLLIAKLQPHTTVNILLLPYGVDSRRFKFRLRKQVKPTLLTMRGFHSIYCPWLAVDAIALLKGEFPDMTLVMTGADKSDGSLERTRKIIAEKALEQKVAITGYISDADLEMNISNSDILLNTPAIDNIPVSTIQAMAAGLCVISTNVGGIPYLIEDGVDGLLVPPNNPLALAGAIRRLNTEPGLAENISFNARRKAEQYDWSFLVPRWEDVFCEAAAT